MSTAELVVAARGGDHGAFRRLVDAHRGLVASIALAIVREVQASEEVAQDVFVHLWRSLPRLRNPASFLPWLRQLTRNRAHRFVSERRRGAVPDEDAVAAAVDDAPDAQAALATLEEARVLAEVLETLSDDTREVLTLYYREGRSAAQVAALLGLREEAVRKRLSRAREMLREGVEARFADVAHRTQPGPELTHSVVAALPMIKVPALLGWKAFFTALPVSIGAEMAVLGSLRRNLRAARDEAERRKLFAVAAVQAVTVALFAEATTHLRVFPHPKIAIVAFTVAFMSVMFGTTLIAIPRITGRAPPRRRYLGAAIAFALGWTPVIWYLVRR